MAASPPAAPPAELAVSEKKKAGEAASSDLAQLLRLEELTLEIGFQLIPLVDEKQGGQLLSRVRSLRRHLSAEMGFLVPPVHISDNLRLKPREYLFSLRGMEIGRWQTEGPQLLAVSGDPNRRPLAGKEAREPAFGVPAIWIAPALEDQAIAAGYSVVDAVTVITTHLGELIRRHAYELLGRAETKRLMDALNESHPKLMEELVPKLLSLGEVGRVLEQLLRERVSIRDLGTILEALLGDRAGEQEPGCAGRGRAPGAGAEADSAAARPGGPIAGAAARRGARRGDSGHAFSGDRAEDARLWRRCRARRCCAA